MIRLIIGLGNPIASYAHTRHNAGVWLVEKIAHHYQVSMRTEPKFKSSLGHFTYQKTRVYLAFPLSFMNHSGQAVRLLSDYYRILPDDILIAHDDLDIAIGEIRLKHNGGHAGHNGLRDIMLQLNSPSFYRLRIGIGHPGNKNLVTNYVLSAPSVDEKNKINISLDNVIENIHTLISPAN